MWILTVIVTVFGIVVGREIVKTTFENSRKTNYKGMVLFSMWVVTYVIYIWVAI